MSETKERLFLLDGTALAYRAHFAFLRARLTDVKGQPTGAIYGFVATLMKLIREENWYPFMSSLSPIRTWRARCRFPCRRRSTAARDKI